MKGFVIVLCVAMAAALAWSNRAEIMMFIQQQQYGMREEPQARRVERSGLGSPMEYLAAATTEEEWKRRHAYLKFHDLLPGDAPGGGPAQYLAAARSATDWEGRYMFLRRGGIFKSGIDDVDEAVAASAHLGDVGGQWYPPRWRNRLTAGRKWVRESEGDGPEEEFCGASEATPPAWAGRTPGVREEGRAEPRTPMTMGRAAKRFVLGVPEDERL